MANRWGNSDRLNFGGAPKSLHMVTVAMKLKDTWLLGRKAMTNLDSILKNRDITLPTKVHLVKAMVFPVVMYGCESWTIKKAELRRIYAFELLCWRRPWESLGLQRDPISPSSRKSVLNIHWKDWCRRWNSNTLATWCDELTHWKRPWCWERLKAKEEGDRGWDGCTAFNACELEQTNSGRWWGTGRPGVLQSTG